MVCWLFWFVGSVCYFGYVVLLVVLFVVGPLVLLDLRFRWLFGFVVSVGYYGYAVILVILVCLVLGLFLLRGSFVYFGLLVPLVRLVILFFWLC